MENSACSGIVGKDFKNKLGLEMKYGCMERFSNSHDRKRIERREGRQEVGRVGIWIGCSANQMTMELAWLA